MRHTPILRYDSRERYRPVPVTNQIAGNPDRISPMRTIADVSGSADRVYGHVANGSDGRMWLSYWFFYPYNDYTLIGPFIGAGRHEGDWEMIELRLDRDAVAPDLALYTQHSHVRARDWNQVERQGAHPIIYVARGSHASYFSPGRHWTGVWFDHADGRTPAQDLELEVIVDGDQSSEWVHRPGRWGTTTPGNGIGNLLGLDASSPHGPGHQRQWRDPARLLADVQPTRRPRQRSPRSASA